MQTGNTVKELIHNFSKSLLPAYGKQDAQAISFLVMEQILGVSKTDQILNREIQPGKDQETKLRKILERLLQGEPVQYILGRASFYGRDYQVDPRVLIPRPETEELAHWIIQEQKSSGLSLLDIGTGSGCLPITLALEMDNPRVFALDIDTEALHVARKNASNLGADIEFFSLDILKDTPPIPTVSILVSNPPYVPRADLATMDNKVKLHEPHLAILVPDNDSLLFYRRLSEIAPAMLIPGGCLYLEIYHAFGTEVCELFAETAWKEVTLKKDLAGKDRFVKAILNST